MAYSCRHDGRQVLTATQYQQLTPTVQGEITPSLGTAEGLGLVRRTAHHTQICRRSAASRWLPRSQSSTVKTLMLRRHQQLIAADKQLGNELSSRLSFDLR